MTDRYDLERLMRHVDGALSQEESAGIEAEAAADPALAARLSAFRSSAILVRDAFPVEGDPRDDALFRMIAASPSVGGATGGPAKSVEPRLQALLRRALSPGVGAVWGGLAAAAFVVGVFVAPRFEPNRFAVAEQGRITDPGIIRVLDTRLTAEGPDGRGRSVGLTFRNSEGRWCRTFRSERAGLAGLACRRSVQGWGVVALAPIGAQGSEIRTAGADTPQVILDAIDANLAGETADASSERAARDTGWR